MFWDFPVPNMTAVTVLGSRVATWRNAWDYERLVELLAVHFGFTEVSPSG